MQWRPCGRFDLKLPILGIGCWSFGGGEYWGPQNQQDVNAVVRCAVDHDCRFFDTAEAYNNGASERSLGEALQGVPRDRVIIGTKISPSHVTPQGVVDHCEASLRRLQTDYVDLYLVHWPITAHSIRHFTDASIPTPSVPAAFDALNRLQRAGKIRWIGVSNFGRERMAEALATGVELAVNELPYSLLARAIETEILPFCREREVGVIGYMSLLQGVLADTYPTLADVPAWRRRTRHFDSRQTPQCRHGLPGEEEATQSAIEEIRGVAKQAGLSTPELALKWAFAGPGVTSSLCGARNVPDLLVNLKAAEEPLAPALLAELNRITAPLREKLGPSFDYYENPKNDRSQ